MSKNPTPVVKAVIWGIGVGGEEGVIKRYPCRNSEPQTRVWHTQEAKLIFPKEDGASQMPHKLIFCIL